MISKQVWRQKSIMCNDTGGRKEGSEKVKVVMVMNVMIVLVGVRRMHLYNCNGADSSSDRNEVKQLQ